MNSKEITNEIRNLVNESIERLGNTKEAKAIFDKYLVEELVNLLKNIYNKKYIELYAYTLVLLLYDKSIYSEDIYDRNDIVYSFLFFELNSKTQN